MNSLVKSKLPFTDGTIKLTYNDVRVRAQPEEQRKNEMTKLFLGLNWIHCSVWDKDSVKLYHVIAISRCINLNLYFLYFFFILDASDVIYE